jgi:benzoate 4-monooxygenase
LSIDIFYSLHNVSKIDVNATMSLLDHLTAHPLLILSLLLAVLYPSILLVYRLFFSPLAKIPGPWLTRISSLPETNALKEQRRTAWVRELFEQNPGAVAVRTGPKAVSFRDPEAVKAIYGR